jgi:tetratricopeptide (TPR) repeat protein
MGKFFSLVILPIVVTVLGGILLYHYPNWAEAEEKLTYSVEATSSLSVKNDVFTVHTLRLQNTYKRRVEEVSFKLKYDRKFEELVVEAADRSNTSHSLDISANKESATIEIPSLRSHEIVTFQVFAKSDSPQSVQLSLKSKNYLGEEAIEESPLHWDFKFISRLLLGVLYFCLIIFFLVRLRRRDFSISSLNGSLLKSRNNTAFVLLHLGLTEDAKSLLLRTIDNSGATAFELSNLAVCYSLEKDYEKASKYLKAASFLVDKEDFSNILLNRGLIAFHQGNLIEAKHHIDKFRAKFPKTFRHYSKYSELLAEAMTTIEGQKSLLTHPSSTQK